ncbi:MAG: HAD-IA family hydrolase [Anaerolineales bacterium]
MIKAVLLDLDDTLLGYPEGGLSAFIRHNLAALDAYFAREHSLPSLQAALVNGVQTLAANQTPDQRNDARYWDVLAPHLPAEWTLADWQTHYNTYIATEYTALRERTVPLIAAQTLVEQLSAAGYAVVIATNPIYTANVIEERLRWAGLPPDHPALWRITHAENSYFAKPQPHYYEEIMLHIGIDPYEAIMVGDSWRNDIQPAAQAGLYTFWVNRGAQIPPGATIQPTAIGSLDDFLDCLLAVDDCLARPPQPPRPAHLFPRLNAAVAVLYGLIHDMPERFWHQRPDPDEWSPMEIVNHLATRESEVQRPRLAHIAAEDNPFISPAPETPPPGSQDLHHLDGHAEARRFAQERAITRDFLGGLPADAWQRPARHSIYGPTDLLEMALFMTRHDALHLTQLCQTIGNCT